MCNLKKVLFSLIFLSALSAQAARKKILIVKTDHSKAFAEFFVTFNSKKDIKFFTWKITRSSGETEKGRFTPADIRNGNVITGNTIKKFVKIESPNFSAQKGGVLKLIAPKNIVLGSKIKITVDYNRNGDSWSVDEGNHYGIRKVFIRVNKRLGVPLGVKGWKYLQTGYTH